MTASGSLRIAWAGPWNAESAIAAFSECVCAALVAAGHRIEIIRTETGDGARLPPRPNPPGPVHAPGAYPAARLGDRFDAVVVNVGNYYTYHALAPALLATAPGVAVLHDAVMSHFAIDWRTAAEPEPPQGLMWAEPLTAALASLACGAVVHGPHYRAEIATACPGPVIELPLAYAPPVPWPPRPFGETITIATIGHVNPNKRADQVIRAIGASPRLRARVRYLLIGPYGEEWRAALLALAASVGAAPPHFTGWVSDAEMLAHLNAVDALACLRHPVSEGGSGSLVLALCSARPVLVSDTGAYRQIPHNLVLRCTPGEEAADVLRHLEWLLDNPDAARQMGERAATYAAIVHGPESYATALVPFLRDVARGAPAIMAARDLGLAGARLGLGPGSPALERAASVLAELAEGDSDAHGPT